MEITVEISYYVLAEDYRKPVREFLDAIRGKQSVLVEAGTMSSLVTGEYKTVMCLLQEKMNLVLEKYPSVFTLKIANACKSCKTRTV
ncbi:MAG: hypothetical protein AB7D05_05050 [Mangrovibacterium sp.]